MNFKKSILLTHVFVRQNENYKLKQIDLSVKHFRKHNEDVYIVLTGHGLSPYKQTLDLCDYVYWSDVIIENEINKGHPKLVNIGLDHIKEKGFNHVLKMRSDGIVCFNDSYNHFKNIIEKENKELLVTQQTTRDKQIGDLFMLSEIDLLKQIWKMDSWNYTFDGMVNCSVNFLNIVPATNLLEGLRKKSSFIDIFNIKWVDFRANWNELENISEENILNNNFDVNKYLWGTKEGWNTFDSNGNYIGIFDNVTEKEFYKKW